jgi:ribose 5-phosphate isomerase B
MKVLVASDHAGIEVKSLIVQALKNQHQVLDLGPDSKASVDYPDFADKVCQQISAEISAQISAQTSAQISAENSVSSHSTEDALKIGTLGILICGSGQGMAMRANKYPLIRAALCWNLQSVILSREHNNANVLCLGARLLATPDILPMVETFLSTKFSGDRHAERVKKIATKII